MLVVTLCLASEAALAYWKAQQLTSPITLAPEPIPLENVERVPKKVDFKSLQFRPATAYQVQTNSQTISTSRILTAVMELVVLSQVR